MEKDPALLKRSISEYFDRTASQYRDVHYTNHHNLSPHEYRKAYIEQMLQRQRIPAGARVLDVGCGPGELVLSLLREGYDVWAVDISQQMVDETARAMEKNGFSSANRVFVADIESLPFDSEFFDVIIAAGVIEYQDHDEPSLVEMKRVLKPDGYLVLNVSVRFSYAGLPVTLYLWVKRHPSTRRLLHVVKNRLLGRSGITEWPDRRSHSPRRFDKKLQQLGFTKVSFNYFNFAPLPSPLDSLLPRAAGRVSQWMERFSTKEASRWIASGYLVMARRGRS